MANNFAGDPNVKALWRFESGALTTDSSGNGNTLTAVGTPTESTGVGGFKEGSCAVSLDQSVEYQAFQRTDGNLSIGFPLKYGTSNNIFTICGWTKLASLAHGLHGDIFAKTYNSDAYESLRIAWYRWNDEYRMTMVQGVAEVEGFNSVIAFTMTAADCIGIWNHIAFTYNDSTKAWTARLWNDTTSTASSNSGTFDHNIRITNCRIVVGGYAWGAVEVYGIMNVVLDEVVVFNRVLSDAEIDKIRQGTYTYRPHDLRLVKKAELPT